jgi:two-component system response regulator AtoC
MKIYPLILIVDDEQDFLDSLLRGLRTAGFKHLKATTDPIEAARLFKDGGDFDIVLIDICMDGIDGFELMKIIRKFSPKTGCIIITGLDEAAVTEQSLCNGACDCLVKPISKDQLIFALNHTMERMRHFDIVETYGHQQTTSRNNAIESP